MNRLLCIQFIDPQSYEASSGFSSIRWAIRVSSVAFRSPEVVRLRMMSHFSRIRPTVSANFSLLIVPLPWSSRMCRWATAAPAFQHSQTSAAISFGVSGMLGLCSFVGQAPVGATEIIVFCIETTSFLNLD